MANFSIQAEYVLRATSSSATSVEVSIETSSDESFSALCGRVIELGKAKVGETDEKFEPATWALTTDGPMAREATTVNETELSGACGLSEGCKVYFFPASVTIYNNTFFKTKRCPN